MDGTEIMVSDSDTDDLIVPHAVFTDPQVGRIGLSEEVAREHRDAVRIGREAFAAQGKLMALGETAAFVKVVTNAASAAWLGSHIVDEQGAEIVQELVLAVRLGATASDTTDTSHIRPTLPETINSAACGVNRSS